MRLRTTTLAVLLAGALAAAGPGAAGPVRSQAATPTDPALQSAPADRLDRLADALRRSPLAVDPELDWRIDATTRRTLLRTIRSSDVPVLVAILPLLTEDESGGDEERVLRGLQQRLRRDALYVVVDQSGTVEESLFGVARRASVPFELRYPPIERRADGERRDPFTTVPDRLDRLVRIVDAAPASSSRAPGVTEVRDLARLPSEYRDDDEDGGVPTAGLAVLLAVVGATAGVGIAFRRIRREDAREAAERAEDERRERERAGGGKRRRGGKRRGRGRRTTKR